MLLGTLRASLLGNMLAEKGVIRDGRMTEGEGAKWDRVWQDF